MATLFDCLQTAIDGREADRTRAEAAQEAYKDLVLRYGREFPMLEAERLAAADIKKAAREATERKRKVVLAQLQTMRRNEAEFGNGAPPLKIVKAVEHTRFDQLSIFKQATGAMADFLRANSRTLTGGTRNPALLRNIMRELHGESTGNKQALDMAGGIRAAQDRMRELFNAYGGDIGELQDFGVPHSHDGRKMRKAGYDAWRAEVIDRIDWSRIKNFETGNPFAAKGQVPGPAAAEKFLTEIYETITTDGWNKRAATMMGGGRALYNQRSDPRLLHFKSADDWMDYNATFGDGDPFSAVMNHMGGMARDIALMRNWGPNPKMGLAHASQVMERHWALGGDDNMRALANKKSKHAAVMMSHLTGAANIPHDHFWAAFFAGTRNLLTAAQLGSAPISAITDMWTQTMAAKAIGMNPTSPVRRAVQLMASSATRETAAAMGYVADTLADTGSSMSRYMGDVWSPEVTERLSNLVLRVNGLSYWTDMNRIGFQMEFAAYMAQNTGKSFAEIDPLLRNVLAGRGITDADWQVLRDPAALFVAPNGTKFLAPNYFLEHSSADRATVEGLMIRLQSIVEEQMEYAVPSVSLEGRTAMIGDAPPGTVYGEVVRSGAMYKNFSLSFTINQWRRTLAQPTDMSRAMYAAQLVAGGTILGGVAVQLKEIAKGNDPRPMDDSKFWWAAFMQGGGVGIFGDFFASETSRAGGGLLETIAGPVAGAVGDGLRIVGSNAARIAEGKAPMLGRDITNFGRRYTPGTSIWYARVAFDRMVWDQMQDFLDPEAQTDWRRKQKRMQRDYGTQSYWERGAFLPERGPDLSNILGGK